jgi:hypothetical protein
MGTTSLSPATATTSAQQADEIEALRVLMAHYALWGDTH